MIVQPTEEELVGVSDIVQTFNNFRGQIYVDSTKDIYLKGAGSRFYTENSYEDGLRILYELIAEPLVASSFLKLAQEVSYLPSYIIPAETDRLMAQVHAKYVEDTFDRIDIDKYFQNCLLAYLVGIVCSEMIWKKDFTGRPYLDKIKTIPPELMRVSSKGVRFLKNVNSTALVDEPPHKFLRYTFSNAINLSPIGDGVGKIIYYLLKERYLLKCLATAYAQRGTTPISIVKTEKNVDAKIVRAFVNALNTADQWKTVALPPGITMESITLAGKYEIYDMLLKQNEAEIVALLAGESIVGADTTSSQRGATEASNLRRVRALSIAKNVVAHINKDIVAPLIDLKFGKQMVYPVFGYTLPIISKQQIATVGEAIALQTQLGYTINPSFFEANYSLDIKDIGFDRKY